MEMRNSRVSWFHARGDGFKQEMSSVNILYKIPFNLKKLMNV